MLRRSAASAHRDVSLRATEVNPFKALSARSQTFPHSSAARSISRQSASYEPRTSLSEEVQNIFSNHAIGVNSTSPKLLGVTSFDSPVGLDRQEDANGKYA